MAVTTHTNKHLRLSQIYNKLTSLGLLAGSNDFSEQMLDVSLSSEPSSNGLLTLRLRGELFCEKERSILQDVNRKQKSLSVHKRTCWEFGKQVGHVKRTPFSFVMVKTTKAIWLQSSIVKLNRNKAGSGAQYSVSKVTG